MIARRFFWCFIAAFVVMGSTACDSGPQAGELEVYLDSPDPDDRAIQFEIAASEPLTIQGVISVCSECQEFVYQENNARLSVIIIGTFGAQPVARVAVSDINSVASYTVTLEAVAGRDLDLEATADRALYLNR